MLANPRRHRRHHRRHHRRNPEGALGGATSLVTHPKMLLGEGLVGALSCYSTISIPNRFLPIAGTDLPSMLMRAASRAVTGGLLWWISRRFLGSMSPAVLVGAAMGSGGALALEALGAQLVIGTGDTAQTGFLPAMGGTGMTLGLSGYGWNRAAAGFGGYVRGHGFNGYVRGSGFGQLPYTRTYAPGRAWPSRGYAGVTGPGSRSMVKSQIYT